MNGVLCRGGRELVLGKAMPKNAQCPPRVRCRSNNQYTMDAQWLKTAIYVIGFSKSRKRTDRTHGDAIFLRKRLRISFGHFREGLIVEDITAFDIQKNSRRHSLA